MRFFFQPRDLWVGVYVSEWEPVGWPRDWLHRRYIYICPLPMIGIRFTQRRVKP